MKIIKLIELIGIIIVGSILLIIIIVLIKLLKIKNKTNASWGHVISIFKDFVSCKARKKPSWCGRTTIESSRTYSNDEFSA